MATLDIASAFRTVPLLPAHKAYTVLCVGDSEFYIDHVVSFGLASGTGVQGAVMDAIIDIFDAEHLGLNIKWVDDLANIRLPAGGGPEPDSFQYTYSVHDIFVLSQTLRVPWGLGKCLTHAYQAVYVGFLWDLWHRTVSLPEHKRLKYLHKLDSFLARAVTSRVLLRDVLSINGTLSHICFVYPQGRAYLTNLCTFVASFHARFVPRYPPKSVLSDLRWWQVTLRVPAVARSLLPRQPLVLDISVDASSSWGVGLRYGDHWNAWQWTTPGWHAHGRDIGWAEMIAVELAARYVHAEGFRNVDVLILSDNQGVVGAYNRGRSRNFHTNESIRRVDILGMALNARFVLQYVSTLENLADPVSRGTPPAGLSRLPNLSSLPEEITAFLAYAE